MKKLTLSLLVCACMSQTALAHTPLCSCYDFGDNTILCEGGFSDGSSASGVEMLVLDAAGKEVITIEGLLSGEKLHPIQEAFVEHDGMQCGFCTSGQIIAAQALLLKESKPTKEQVLEGMSGNLCRCGAYPHIIESVLAAAEK